MRRRTVLILATALGITGCLAGTYLTSDATWTGTSSTTGWYGFRVAGGFRGDFGRAYDVAVGAPAESKVYVHLNPTTSAAAGPYTFTGSAGGEAGFGLDTGEIVGGDSMQELVIGAPAADSGKGRVHVIKGGTFTKNLGRRDTWVTFVGDAATEYAGWDVATGDFNGDGHGDLLIGACGRNSYAGRVYRVDGPLPTGSQVLSSAADFILDGVPGSHSNLGCSLAASDIDGDGADEMILGAWWGDISKGQVFVVDGSLTGSKSISTLAASDYEVITGSVTGGQLGYRLDGGADFDGDGKEDLLIGEPRKVCSDPRDPSICPPVPGRAHLVLGASAFAGGPINTVAAATITGTTGGDILGSAVTFLDDHNGDSYADIAIGARGEHKVYMWYGRPDPKTNLGSVLSSAADATIDGSAAGKNAGASLAAAGYIDNDGNMDLLIGARALDWAYYSTPGTGEAYIFTGHE